MNKSAFYGVSILEICKITMYKLLRLHIAKIWKKYHNYVI